MKTLAKAYSTAVNAKSIDDIIFEGRNHKYGAYFLRKHYNNHLFLSLTTVLLFVITITGVSHVRTLMKPVNFIEPFKTIVSIEPVSFENIFLPPPPPERINTAISATTKRQQESAPEVVEKLPQGIVKPSETQSLQSTTPVVSKTVIITKSITPPVNINPPIKHTKSTVTKPPKFKGGDERKFCEWLGRNISYPVDALETGISGKIVVQFAVDNDGKVCDVSIERGLHPIIDGAAIKAILRSPKWEPAEYKGEKVKVYFIIPLTFNIQSNRN